MTFEEIEKLNVHKTLVKRYLEGICNGCYKRTRNVYIFIKAERYFPWVRCNQCAHEFAEGYKKLELSEQDIFTLKCLI